MSSIPETQRWTLVLDRLCLSCLFLDLELYAKFSKSEKKLIFQWTEQADSCNTCLLLTIPNPAKTGRSCNRLFRHLPPYSQTYNACLYYQRQSPTPLNTKTVWNGISAATSSALQCKDCRMQMHCWLCMLERMTQYLQAGAPDGAFPASKSQEKERGRKTHEVIRCTVCLTDSRGAIRFETSKLPLGISLREETTSVACRSSKGTVSLSLTGLLLWISRPAREFILFSNSVSIEEL